MPHKEIQHMLSFNCNGHGSCPRRRNHKMKYVPECECATSIYFLQDEVTSVSEERLRFRRRVPMRWHLKTFFFQWTFFKFNATTTAEHVRSEQYPCQMDRSSLATASQLSIETHCTSDAFTHSTSSLRRSKNHDHRKAFQHQSCL